MPKTVPCLWFDRQAEQAAELYTSVFPNSRITGTTRYPANMPGPEGAVMTVSFTLDGQEYLGLNGGPEFKFSEAVSFQIMCADQEEIDHYWTALTDGGEEGPCGWLKDRFGLSWQVVPTPFIELIENGEPERVQRSMEAMMKMRKLDVAELLRAADRTPA